MLNLQKASAIAPGGFPSHILMEVKSLRDVRMVVVHGKSLKERSIKNSGVLFLPTRQEVF